MNQAMIIAGQKGMATIHLPGKLSVYAQFFAYEGIQ